MSENEVQGLDLSSLGQKVEEALHDCPVKFNEDGDPLVGFKVVDSNSDTFRQAKRAVGVQVIKRVSVRKQRIDGKTDEGAAQLFDLAHKQNAQLALACVKDWYGFSNGGKKAEFSAAALEKVFTAYPEWVDTVLAKVNEAGSFFGSSPKS